jgi:hypothetical protein
MNDLIPIAFFVACLLATLGLLRVCERLRPASTSSEAHACGARKEAAR